MSEREKRYLIEETKETEFKMRDKINVDCEETFGVEVEFEGVKLNTIKYGRNWDVKIDDTVTRSVDGYKVGGEASSPILNDTEECWRDVEHLCSYLSKKGATVTSEVGGHIHIGSQALKNDPNNIRKLLKSWELFEPIIYSFSSGKDTCLRAAAKIHAKNISPILSRVRNSKNGYGSYRSYYDWLNFFKKYKLVKVCGINFSNYRGCEKDVGNTIEIRCPNGTIDPVIWQNNINFFIKFMERCSRDNFDEEYIDYLLRLKNDLDFNSNVNFDSVIELVDLVFDNRLDKLMFLKQYLKLFSKDEQENKNRTSYSV